MVDLADAVQLVARDSAARWPRGHRIGYVGTCISSTSSAARTASREPASAATNPASMFAPSALVATGPMVFSAAAIIRVVVDLPLVPVTTTVRRPGSELAQDRLVQGHRDESADHGTGSASGHPGGPARVAPAASAARPRMVKVWLGIDGECMPTRGGPPGCCRERAILTW